MALNCSNHKYVNHVKQLPIADSAAAEVLIATDACVKALEEEDCASLNLSLLVNYDLPAKRVCITRTVSHLLYPHDHLPLTAIYFNNHSHQLFLLSSSW